MFSFYKRSDVCVLSYEPNRTARYAAMILAPVAIVGGSSLDWGSGSRWAILGGAVAVAGTVAFWVLWDAPTETRFDLAGAILTVSSERPFFGPPRSAPFAARPTIEVRESVGESADSWAVFLRLPGGERVLLGRELQGRNSRIRDWIAEIRQTTGL